MSRSLWPVVIAVTSEDSPERNSRCKNESSKTVVGVMATDVVITVK